MTFNVSIRLDKMAIIADRWPIGQCTWEWDTGQRYIGRFEL